MTDSAKNVTESSEATCRPSCSMPSFSARSTTHILFNHSLLILEYGLIRFRERLTIQLANTWLTHSAG